MDFGHIITALNKLDAGATEHLLLSGRERDRDREASAPIMVVTFEDIKKCVEQVYLLYGHYVELFSDISL